MLSYLLKIFALLLFSFFILFNYYFVFPEHINNFDGYLSYIVIIGIIYSIYKYFQLDYSKDKAVINLKTVIGFFFLNLFVLCIYYFNLIDSGNIFLNGVTLFFKILFYSIFPVIVYLISLSFGKKILERLSDKEEFGKGVFWMLELVVGLVSFLSIIVIFGILGFYNLVVVFLVLALFLVLSYKELFKIFKDVTEVRYEFDIKKGSYLNLLSVEFFTIFSFLVLGVGLISIVRPFPIGWDDLGVYMNYPHLMAEAGNLLSLGAMYSWQTFTGIGYMFGSPVFAFFLNISGLFLTYIVLLVVFSNLIKSVSHKKDTIINIPVILSSIFISLPMVGFQTTKDLKVDEGLFFISVVLLFFLYKYFLLLKNEKHISIYYLFIIGIIAGFAFSIKFTALLLIVAIVGVISFARVGIIGFFAYLSVFFGIFTLANLWKMMNVVINPNMIPGFETTFGISSIVLGIILFGYTYFKNKKNFLNFGKEFLVFIFGLFLVLLPWFGKNIGESYLNLSFSSIISGKADYFNVDYSKIYSSEEISQIRQEKVIERKKENSITTNEDFLRYFGYEKGINDFVYLPWNLTMQVNQKGEYTDIGFLFLALLPLIFIFLPYRKKHYALFFVGLSIIQFLFYFEGNKKEIDYSSYSNVSTGSLENVFIPNDLVFVRNNDFENIFDIDIYKYIDDEVIYTGLNTEEITEKTKQYLSDIALENAKIQIIKSSIQTQENYNLLYQKNLELLAKDFEKYYNEIFENDFNEFKKVVNTNFYLEIKDKVLNLSLGKDISFLTVPLDENDYQYIKKLNTIYNSTGFFNVGDVVSLNNLLVKNHATDEEIKIINNIWNENRTLKGKIVDFFAKINLPFGYVFIFLVFILPTIYLLVTLKHGKINYIFKLNLIFASVYTFLWAISSFGIVWYGITMYFSFLLMIGLGAFFITNYDYDIDDKKYIYKIMGTIVFLIIILIYFFNSLFPYIFSNLKNAGYSEFKVGKITQAESIFVYHDDYKNILFTLNIDESKIDDFLKENIDETIYLNIKDKKIEDISQVFNILKEYQKDKNYELKAKKSIQDLYKSIQNPGKEFANKEKIYRVGTFLKYYISENNNRLYEDSLLFSFDDYIYDNDSDITIDRFKKLGLKYLLIDLNAATIDKSDTHDLTKRYENLLKTFNNDRLELIETDSVCLKLALDLYDKNNDINEYFDISGVNYDSYDENNNMISRSKKRIVCINYINNLLDQDKINENNYSYLLPYKSYFEKNTKTLQSLDNVIGMSYKALFKIK
ncbi:MAG: hypothetical protein PHI37_02640 [Candidatus Gracilibacteria bacterium]|nr:hypothetical protein [Candidatus Gracilibacteria bacterium]